MIKLFGLQGKDIRRLSLKAELLKRQLEKAQIDSAELIKKQDELRAGLEGFYGKIIEIFGLFIAIFSFIIAGIQIAAKLEGSPTEMLGKSLALFAPLTLCIVVLLCVIRWTSRR